MSNSWKYLKYNRLNVDQRVLIDNGILTEGQETGSENIEDSSYGLDSKTINDLRRNEIINKELNKLKRFIDYTPQADTTNSEWDKSGMFPALGTEDVLESGQQEGNLWKYLKYNRLEVDQRILIDNGILTEGQETGSENIEDSSYGLDSKTINDLRRNEIINKELNKLKRFIDYTPQADTTNSEWDKSGMFPDDTTTEPSGPTGTVTVKSTYKDLGGTLGKGLEITLESDTNNEVTGFDFRFDETGESSSWKYLKLESGGNAATVNPPTTYPIFDSNTDWHITHNTENHPSDGLTRINGFTGKSTENNGTWTFDHVLTLTANTPLSLLRLLPGTNSNDANVPQLVYADVVKSVGGLLYNDDEGVTMSNVVA